MIQNQIPDAEPPELRQALADVWREKADVVRRFRLAHFPGGAIGSPPTTNYFIMISCGDPSPEPRELVQALQQLEFAIEDKSGLSVALMLFSPDDSRYSRVN